MGLSEIKPWRDERVKGIYLDWGQDAWIRITPYPQSSTYKGLSEGPRGHLYYGDFGLLPSRNIARNWLSASRISSGGGGANCAMRAISWAHCALSREQSIRDSMRSGNSQRLGPIRWI